MGRFLDPKADLTFKKVFGEHKHLVMSLLNALLPLKAYSGQLTKGEDYDLLQPVCSLNLVNDTFDWDTADYYHHYQLVEDQNHRKVLDGLHLQVRFFKT